MTGFVTLVKETSKLHVELVQPTKTAVIDKDNKVHECNGFQMKYDDMGNKTIISMSVKDSKKIDLNTSNSEVNVQLGELDSEDGMEFVGSANLVKKTTKTTVTWTKN